MGDKGCGKVKRKARDTAEEGKTEKRRTQVALDKVEWMNILFINNRCNAVITVNSRTARTGQKDSKSTYTCRRNNCPKNK